MGDRFRREKKTIAAMIQIYCRDQHGGEQNLCAECDELLRYAHARLDKCPHRDPKPVCAQCKIHCYLAGKREKIRDVMRYAGPRMLKSHPILAVRHIIDARTGKTDD